MKFKLETPVVFGSETISELDLRDEVVTGDMRGIKASELADPLPEVVSKFVARLSGRPEAGAIVMKMKPKDYFELVKVVLGFLKLGQDENG